MNSNMPLPHRLAAVVFVLAGGCFLVFLALGDSTSASVLLEPCSDSTICSQYALRRSAGGQLPSMALVTGPRRGRTANLEHSATGRISALNYRKNNADYFVDNRLFAPLGYQSLSSALQTEPPRRLGKGTISQHAMQAKKKKLLKALIGKLGKPCSEQCTGEEGVNAKECHKACEQRKMKKMKTFLAGLTEYSHERIVTERALSTLEKGIPNQEARAEDAARISAREEDVARKNASRVFFAGKFAKNKLSTRYPSGLVDIFGRC